MSDYNTVLRQYYYYYYYSWTVEEQLLLFSSSNSQATLFIPIIDDTEIESIESFQASLVVQSSLFPAVTLDPPRTTVHIISNDCMSITLGAMHL